MNTSDCTYYTCPPGGAAASILSDEQARRHFICKSKEYSLHAVFQEENGVSVFLYTRFNFISLLLDRLETELSLELPGEVGMSMAKKAEEVVGNSFFIFQDQIEKLHTQGSLCYHLLNQGCAVILLIQFSDNSIISARLGQSCQAILMQEQAEKKTSKPLFPSFASSLFSPRSGFGCFSSKEGCFASLLRKIQPEIVCLSPEVLFSDRLAPTFVVLGNFRTLQYWKSKLRSKLEKKEMVPGLEKGKLNVSSLPPSFLKALKIFVGDLAKNENAVVLLLKLSLS